MAGKPDHGDIKITVSFLKEFQANVLQPMVDELDTNVYVLEIGQAESSGPGARRLLPGSEAWDPAKQLIERYEGATGTARTLYVQVKAIREKLVGLNQRITQAVKDVTDGEYENLKLTTELDLGQVNVILTGGSGSTGTPAPVPVPSPAPGPGTSGGS
ncbi:hypothetical protein ABTX61_09120 [Amycolatopsis japonica]|uniref:hypothetical protein n=1 Tax=Amycolatopsis japonica TaxID=208439 RepID=UPI003333F0D0